MIIKSLVKKIFPKRLYFYLVHIRKKLSLNGFKADSYSGDAEDIVLGHIFKNINSGFYVDVGAFHPKYLSNTYKLYKKGWSGINIDPNYKSIKLLKRYRPNDINLELGISEKNEEMTYFDFMYFGVNTMSKDHADSKINIPGNELIETRTVQCLPLVEILDTYAKGKHINLLDVDVEGLDLAVLKSNDWNRYKPDVILIEDRDFRISMGSSEIYMYLSKLGYIFHSYNNITLIMKMPNSS